MKTITKTIAAVLCALPLATSAQVSIDFESAGQYKALGVYDVWEQSPFRNGVLSGNWGITANPDKEVNEITGEISNGSDHVLGAQRSRFGSNRFGVRIDLNEGFAITPTAKYVHVMIHKPKAGRVMLVGLGSRDERKGQNPYTEQFWELSTNAIEPGTWYDAVFAVRGNAGITVRSLVVVPDCESPHNLTEDFLFYIDNIEVNNSPLPRISNEYYPIIGTKASTSITRTDRFSTGIKIKIGSKTQTLGLAQSENKKLYQDLTGKAFYAKPGQTITPSISFPTDWMHAYCYIDYNNDGAFLATINDDGTPAEGSELVTYNYYNGKNSKGNNANENQGNPGSGQMPAFTLPADITPGMYRMRMKIDWDCIDPMGNSGNAEGRNLITDNGGVIADVMLCVYGDQVTVNDFQLNGEIITADGTKLNSLQVPADADFTIVSNPEKGFHNGGVDIKCGFNLTGDPVDKYGNTQYTTTFVPVASFNENGQYTIPAENMHANLLIEGRMVEDGSGSPVSEAYLLNFPEDLSISRDDRKLTNLRLAVDKGTDLDIDCTDNTGKLVYINKVDNELNVEAGATITPTVTYEGRAMHTYFYIDLNEDGIFANAVNADGTPDGEMLSYSCYNGKNSKGETITSPGGVSPSTSHPFTIPADTEPGVYRARFKIDWNNSDPGGQYGTGSNDINDNAGYVLDYMIHVYAPTTQISTDLSTTKGAITTGQGTVITPEGIDATRNQPITVSIATTIPDDLNGIVARYGYHLDHTSAWFKGHYLWHEITLTPEADGSYTLPAEIMDRPVRLFVTLHSGSSSIDSIRPETTDSNRTYNLQGISIDKPAKGTIYIVNGKKVFVK